MTFASNSANFALTQSNFAAPQPNFTNNTKKSTMYIKLVTDSRHFCKSLAMTQSQAFLCISPITQGKIVAEKAQATLSWRMNKSRFARV